MRTHTRNKPANLAILLFLLPDFIIILQKIPDQVGDDVIARSLGYVIAGMTGNLKR